MPQACLYFINTPLPSKSAIFIHNNHTKSWLTFPDNHQFRLAAVPSPLSLCPSSSLDKQCSTFNGKYLLIKSQQVSAAHWQGSRKNRDGLKETERAVADVAQALFNMTYSQISLWEIWITNVSRDKWTEHKDQRSGEEREPGHPLCSDLAPAYSLFTNLTCY